MPTSHGRGERARVLLMLALALHGTGQVHAASPQRVFEPRFFTGLTAQVITREEDATLDIDFDRIGGGLLSFRHCRELLPDALVLVQPSQLALVNILRLNCQAVHRYVRSQPARRSHLPARWSAAAVAAMPSALLPRLGPVDAATTPATVSSDLPAGAGSTLARQPGRHRVTQAADGSVRVTGSEVLAVFHRLARADFDGDGSEDWLLRIDWAARDGDARGSELVLVARPLAGGPIQLVERMMP